MTERPISIEFHPTPQLYVAVFRDEYDGALDSRCPVGVGKTKAEAVADLLDKESESGAQKERGSR